MNETYEKDEIIDRLKKLEADLLRRVFKSSYSESLRTYDLVNHMKSKARELGLDDCEPFVMLLGDLDRLSASIGGLINGHRGERAAEKSLQCLRGENLVLTGIALRNGESFEEYDEIVITHAGVFLIEVKNFSRDALIDEGGVLRCGPCAYNVGERMREKEHAFWDAIRFSASDFMNEDDVHSMLLFVNDTTKVSDFFHRIPLKRRGQIVYDIEEASRDDRLLTWEEMRRIRSAIVMRKVEARFPMPIDAEKLANELETVLSLIKAKTTEVDRGSAVPGRCEADGASEDLTTARAEENDDYTKPVVNIVMRKWIPAATAVLGIAVGVSGFVGLSKCR